VRSTLRSWPPSVFALGTLTGLLLSGASVGAEPTDLNSPTNIAKQLTPQQVARRGVRLHRELVDAGLWPFARTTTTIGGTCFRHLGATSVNLPFVAAARLMHDLDGVSRRIQVRQQPNDLVYVHGVRGSRAARRLTLLLEYGFPLSESVAYFARVRYGPKRSGVLSATARFHAEQGFVRKLDIDIVLVAEPSGVASVGMELVACTDWRGVAVTRSMFERHVVRKVRAILESLVGRRGQRR